MSVSPQVVSQSVAAEVSTDGNAVLKHIELLDRQLQELKAQVRQAQQLATMGTAVCTVSHEFRNVATSVLSYAKFALDSDDAELHKKALSSAVKGLDALIAMSERVLEVSASKTAEQEAVSLRGIVDDGAAALCRSLDKDGIVFRNDVEDDVSVWVDRLHLQQVFFNLFLNARDAMAPGRSGMLKVTSELSGDRRLIRVKDTGPGIPDEIIKEVFQSFKSTRKKTEDGKVRCSGLGLALCKDLVEENHGELTVESTPSESTVFTIDLPATGPR